MIKQINFSEIAGYQKEAEKSGLCFSGSTIYFALIEAEQMRGFIGVVLYSNKAVVKNIFVPKEFRGHGYFKIMLTYILEFIKLKNISRVEATCTEMSLREFLTRGFNVIRKYKTYTKVQYENL
ncbi:MAG: GNAT family N-acetyltransferase [Bacteroidales bacterium]